MDADKIMESEKGTPFDREAWPFFWIARVLGRYHAEFEGRLKRLGLDIARWRVLMCLVEDAGMSISDLAEEALVKVPTMMKLAQRMEHEGLVTLENRPSDGRVTDVILTAKGLDLRSQALEQATRIHDASFGNLGAGEQKALLRYLRIVSDSLAN